MYDRGIENRPSPKSSTICNVSKYYLPFVKVSPCPSSIFDFKLRATNALVRPGAKNAKLYSSSNGRVEN